VRRGGGKKGPIINICIETNITSQCQNVNVESHVVVSSCLVSMGQSMKVHLVGIKGQIWGKF
jgi:hypothetical protein